jgi:protein-S-isoprenylcysteine O-methyltransferase Ste14
MRGASVSSSGASARAYHFVRNPMYLAVLSAIIGQALLFGQRSLLVYADAAAVFFVSFVHLYQEPTPSSPFRGRVRELLLGSACLVAVARCLKNRCVDS